jgi:hypothetical protein
MVKKEEAMEKEKKEEKKKNVQMLNFMIIASRSFLHYTSFLMLKSPSHVPPQHNTTQTRELPYSRLLFCSVRFDIEYEDSERGFLLFLFMKNTLHVLRRVLKRELNGLQFMSVCIYKYAIRGSQQRV